MNSASPNPAAAQSHAAPSHAAQSAYQVRFGRGPGALETVARHADVVIWVDALPSLGPEGTPAATVLPALHGVPVILADLRTRTSAAKWMLDQQVLVGDRVSVAVIAAADTAEDTLAAGAVIDALAALGIDFSSPEAAVACASFTALERAVAHLFTASVSGRLLIENGFAEIVAVASGIDSQPPVVA